MPQDREDDREVVQQAKPFIRSIAAFLLYLRFGSPAHEENPNVFCYTVAKAHDDADRFLKVLDEDLKA